MFECVCRWRDLTDGHLYHEGDEFPFDGREVPENRIAELETGRNSAGLVLIKRGCEKVEEKPEATEETPKKATRTRKKATK